MASTNFSEIHISDQKCSLMKKAVVTGISERDGAYLAKLPLQNGYEVLLCLVRHGHR